MRKAFLIAIALVLLLPTLASAKPKKKTYGNAPQDVFQAALKTARDRHVVTFVDEKNLLFTFSTGASAFSQGFIANASIEPAQAGGATLTINVQKKDSGSLDFDAGDRMADKFFDQVTEELAGETKQAAALKPAAAPVTIPASVVATQVPSSAPGTVTVSTTPGGADISVDGNFVGSAPANLKLPPGKHTIAVSLDGFKTWTRDMTVLGGSKTNLDATLEKR
ncbi:MAG TPA: PEGA domain-containing protein [Candidatus Acidoferrales bacterium]